VKRRNIAETGVMENISVADFLRDLMKFDNETGRWDVSELVSKMAGNFHQAPRMIANALAVVILASNSGSMLAIGWRDRRTRFTANLRQLYASAAHPVARGRIMFATFSTVDAFVRLCMRPCRRKHFRPVCRRPLISFSIWRPSAILDFQKFANLTANTVWRISTSHRAKFRRNQSNRCGDIAIFRFSKMVVIRHLGLSRFTANLRIVMSLSLSNVLIGVCVLLSNIPLVPVVDGNAETCAFTHCKRH